MNQVSRRYAPWDLFRSQWHAPGQITRWNMSHQPVIGDFAKRHVLIPILQIGVHYMQPQLGGEREIAPGRSIRIAGE